MRFSAKRLFAAGAIGISAIVTPIALTVALPGVGGLTTVAGAQGSGPDTITFNQPSGTPDTYVFTSPAGSTQTTQQVTPSGKCGTPSVSGGSPILSITGKEYNPTSSQPPNNYTNYYLNSWSSDPPSLTSGATGACNISPPQSIENKSGKGAEALDFSVVGANTSIIGANRLFTDAQMMIQRKDSGVAQNPSVNVVLVEFDSSGNKVGSQSCLINGGQGAQVFADTATAAADAQSDCTGTSVTQTGFSTVEVQDWTTSTSISVVGPTATFTLAGAVCGGGHVSTPSSDTVNATLYLTGPSTQCKTYTTFSSSINSQTNSPILNFNGYSTQPVTFTVKITWPLQPECQPYNDAGVPADLTLPMCAPHEISVDGTDYFDQAYCQSPNTAAEQPQGGMCTVDKTYNNDTETVDPNTGAVTGTQGLVLPNCTPSAANNNCAATQVTEIWVGDIDMWWK